MSKLNADDIEELAWLSLGKKHEEIDSLMDGEGDIEGSVFEKYGISFEQFTCIIEDLIKFTPIVKTGLTDTKYHAFVDPVAMRMICRVEP
jgi:hypothetical protein